MIKENALNDLKSLAIKITNQCNLNCIMCGQNKYLSKNKDENSEVLNLETLKNVVDQVKKYSPQIYIWGGEPFLYKDLSEFLVYLNKINLSTFITTNGVLLNRYYKDIVDNKVTEIAISLDGLGEVHNKIRGKNVFSTIITNLHMLNDYKKETGKVFPIIDIHLVIVNENHKYIKEFVDYIRKEKLCRRIRIQLPMFFNDKMCQEQQEYVLDTFHVDNASSFNNYIEDYNINIDKLQNDIEDLKASSRNIIFFPNNANLEKWFESPMDPLTDKKCNTSKYRINLEPNGDIVACPNFPETVYGNIKDYALEAIFNNEIIDSHRKNISNQVSGICPRCSYLYLY